MKKILLILLIAITFIIPNVYAIDELPETEEPVTIDNQTVEDGTENIYTYGEFKFQITGYKIYVYPIENEEGSNTTTSGMEEYLDNVPEKVIPLSMDDITLNPTFKEDKLLGLNTLYINATPSFTKQDMQDFLDEEINSTTSTLGYIAELVVVYKIIEYPDKYTKMYTTELTKDILRAFMALGNPDNTSNGQELYDIDINVPIEQTINVMQIPSTGNGEFFYTKKTEDLMETSSTGLVMNWNGLLENGITPQSENLKDKSFNIMFHELEDLETVFLPKYREEQTFATDDAFDSEDDGQVNPSTATENDQLVKVDDTSATISNFAIFTSIFLIGVGVILVATTAYRKFREKSQD